MVAKLPISHAEKAKQIRTKGLKIGLYGCETSVNESKQKKLASAIKKTVNNNVRHKDANITFIASSFGPDVDPEISILSNSVNMLGRTRTTRPHLLAQATRVLAGYILKDYNGTNIHAVTIGQTCCAPPPRDPERASWRPHYQPFGPVGLILQQLHEKGAAMDKQFAIHAAGWPTMSALSCPLQDLKTFVPKIAVNARTSAHMNK